MATSRQLPVTTKACSRIKRPNVGGTEIILFPTCWIHPFAQRPSNSISLPKFPTLIAWKHFVLLTHPQNSASNAPERPNKAPKNALVHQSFGHRTIELAVRMRVQAGANHLQVQPATTLMEKPTTQHAKRIAAMNPPGIRKPACEMDKHRNTFRNRIAPAIIARRSFKTRLAHCAAFVGICPFAL